MFVNFFLLCYALESSRPRLDFPLEDHGAAIFSSISYALVSLQRLSILSFLSYLSDQFIKSSLIQLYSPQFRCVAALYTMARTNVKQMFVFLRKNFEIFLSYAQWGQGYEIHTPMYMAYFCLMRSFLYLTPNMVIPNAAAASDCFMPLI